MRRRRANTKTSEAEALAQLPYAQVRNPFAPVEVLTPEQVERIKAASFRILEETGMQIRDAGARRALREAGLDIDEGEQRVRCGREGVLEATRKAQVTVRGRDPAKRIRVGEGYMTDTAVHDSQVVDDILDPDNTASEVWANSAYRSAEIEAKLDEKGLKSRIHRKGHRNKPLSAQEEQGNKTRSKVRVRVEHPGSGPGQANRGSEQRHGRDAGARHRAGAGQGADRAEEPRLQHAPPGAVGAPGGGATMTVFRAGVRADYEFRDYINRSAATKCHNPDAG